MSLHDLSNTIDHALAAAGLNTRGGAAGAVVETIRKALEAARISQRPRAGKPEAPGFAARDAQVIDIDAQVIDTDETLDPVAVRQPSRPGGQFLTCRHTGPRGTMAYKLYVPASYARGARMPLVVMLHGCKQNPDDFARGTRINHLAEEQGFLVAFPAQSGASNGSNCWNWFEPQHQNRNGPEPSAIVGIVREISSAYRVDERSVFVAGLSAGAAMAVILGESYPDVFAAVAAHSGLPLGAAHDVPSAFGAMNGVTRPLAREAPAASRTAPIIVFHGDADVTVVPGNSAAIVRQSVDRLSAERGLLSRRVEQRVVDGRRCTRTTHVDREGSVVVEHWAVQGGGHAWFGGSRAGSFADPNGPDASREMMRFFVLHSNEPAARPQAEAA